MGRAGSTYSQRRRERVKKQWFWMNTSDYRKKKLRKRRLNS